MVNFYDGKGTCLFLFVQVFLFCESLIQTCLYNNTNKYDKNDNKSLFCYILFCLFFYSNTSEYAVFVGFVAYRYLHCFRLFL